jgi:hypothetical protein
VATRRERVVLELEDNFTAGAAKAAAAATLLKREVDGINGAGGGSNGGVAKVAKDVDNLSASAVKGSREIDKYSGRLRLLTDLAIVLGPAAVVAGAGLAGMGVSAGVAGLALYGLGDALTALNKYQLEPTAANLDALNQEMSKAGPAGREFVLFLDGLGPKFTELQMVARAGFLPGLQEGIESLMTRFPEVREIVADLADELGDLAAKGGEWLAGPGFDAFQEFLAYARSQGPAVAEFTRSLAEALIGIGRALAPVGQVTLPILTDLLNILAKIANSPIGPALAAAATAFTVVSRSAQVAEFAMGRFGGSTATAAKGLDGLAGKAAGVLLLGQALGALANSFNTGNAINAADLGRDIESITDGRATDSIKRLSESLEDVNERGAGTVNALFAIPSALFGVKTSFEQGKETIDAFDQQLAQMVESGKADEAAKLFERIRAAAAAHGGVSDSDVVKQFDSYKTALDNAAGGARNAASGVDDFSGSISSTLSPVALLSARLEELNGWLDKRSAFRNYQDSIDAFAKSLKDNARNFDITTAKGRANQQALDGVAASVAQVAEKMKDPGRRANFIRSAIADLRSLAKKSSPEAAAAIQTVIGQLRTLSGKTAKPKVVAQTQAALAAIGGVEARLRELNGRSATVTSYFKTIYTSVGKPTSKTDPTLGGLVPKRAAGGPIYGPGTATSDSIPAYLSNGEYVIRAAAVQKYGLAMFDSLNAQRFAGGGRVGRGGDSLLERYGIDIDYNDGLKKRLRLFGEALNRATKSLDDEKSARDSLMSSISGGLSGDLFSSSGSQSAFSGKFAAGSVGDVNSRLRQQIADARQFATLEKQLRARGVSGAAFQAVIESGDINRLRQFAAASNSELRQYQSLYSQRGAAVSTAAKAGAGAAGMTAHITRMTSDVHALAVEVKALRKAEARHHDEAQKTRKQQPNQTAHAVTKGAKKGAGRR